MRRASQLSNWDSYSKRARVNVLLAGFDAGFAAVLEYTESFCVRVLRIPIKQKVEYVAKCTVLAFVFCIGPASGPDLLVPCPKYRRLMDGTSAVAPVAYAVSCIVIVRE